MLGHFWMKLDDWSFLQKKIWGSGQALAETGLALSDNVLKLNDGLRELTVYGAKAFLVMTAVRAPETSQSSVSAPSISEVSYRSRTKTSRYSYW